MVYYSLLSVNPLEVSSSSSSVFLILITSLTRPSCAWRVGPLALERVIICSLICYCQVKLFIRCNVNYQRTDWRVNECIHVCIFPSWNISFTRVLSFTIGSSPLNDMYCVHFSFCICYVGISLSPGLSFRVLCICIYLLTEECVQVKFEHI